MVNPVRLRFGTKAREPGRALDGEVFVYRGESSRAAHDHATCSEIARKLAALKGFRFAGDYDEHTTSSGNRYFVPTDTLVGAQAAGALGIEGEHHLFGGVVPYPFVATKCISHPLVDDSARVPDGWSDAFAQQVRDAVLFGFAAFTVDDALRAARSVMALGPVRIKRALGVGGYGQTVVEDLAALEAALADADAGEVWRYGISLEQDLARVTTLSVGQVRVDDLLATYCGVQRLTKNNAGASVYGGSDLLLARGDFDALLRLDHSRAVRRAIDQARIYDAAAFRCFDGMIASRRNYDVAQGIDAAGRACSGVLEQSWRVGGASGAEVEALVAFRNDPALRAVCASTTEIYGENAAIPAHASVYYQGIDDRAGPLTKYAAIEAYVHA